MLKNVLILKNIYVLKLEKIVSPFVSRKTYFLSEDIPASKVTNVQMLVDATKNFIRCFNVHDHF